MTGQTKLTVNLLTKVTADLVEVSALTELSKTSCVNRAITLYAWVEGKRHEGCDLALIHPDGTIEKVTLL